MAGSSAVNTVCQTGSGIIPTISGSNAIAIINLNGGQLFIGDGANGGTSRDLTLSKHEHGRRDTPVYRRCVEQHGRKHKD